MIKNYFICVLLIVSFLSEGFTQTQISGFIDTNTTWSLSGSPYVITGSVIIEEGVTLDIEAGVVIKVERLNSINIDGTLNAIGTLQEPIVFTSIKDDSFGGDTNGDGNASSPSEGEWIRLHFRETSTNSIMEHCILKHGGQTTKGAVSITESSPTIQDCIFEENEVALRTFGNTSPIINNNNFSNNFFTPIQISLNTNFSEFLNNSFSNNEYQGIGISDEVYEENYSLKVPQLQGLENVPYVVLASITIEPEGKLTIEEGVVIKVLRLNSINIEGTLNAIGTSQQPIVITSIKDDNYGGDTNGDGNASAAS